jgi:hypothetical protein
MEALHPVAFRLRQSSHPHQPTPNRVPALFRPIIHNVPTSLQPWIALPCLLKQAGQLRHVNQLRWFVDVALYDICLIGKLKFLRVLCNAGFERALNGIPG